MFYLSILTYTCVTEEFRHIRYNYKYSTTGFYKAQQFSIQLDFRFLRSFCKTSNSTSSTYYNRSFPFYSILVHDMYGIDKMCWLQSEPFEATTYLRNHNICVFKTTFTISKKPHVHLKVKL